MKKFILLASVVALVVSALAIPALAQDRFDRFFGDNDNPRGDERQAERFAEFLDEYFYAEDNDDQWENSDWWEDHDEDFDNAGAPIVAQESDQSAISGDVNQSFNVSNTGDNSNQCAGIQGVANTGNTQNQLSVTQVDDDEDFFFFDDDNRRHDWDRDRDGDTDFEFEEVNSTIEVSPESTTTCDQQVNQAASATG